MPNENAIIALITSLTTGHILFLALYLWIRPGTHRLNRILSLLLFCYALRIIKSVLLLAFPGLPFADSLIAIGVIGMSAIGPLLWIYVQSIMKEDFSIHFRTSVHFLPTLILTPTAFFLDDRSMYQVYQFSVYQIITYVVITIFYFKKWKKTNPGINGYIWIKELFTAAGSLSVIFLIQLYTDNRVVYMTASVLAAIIFYTISLRATFVKNPLFPQLKKRPKGGKANILHAIDSILNDDQLFLDPQLTVAKLALALKIPTYTVSAAINEEAGMGYNEFLNTYRVKEAARRLFSPQYELLSIEGIANDCGFNSLSAFYNAFKKVFNTTPARFRQKSFPDSINEENLHPNPERR